MFELSRVNYEEVLEQGDSILVRVIASSSYRGFELSGLYCTNLFDRITFRDFDERQHYLLNTVDGNFKFQKVTQKLLLP